MSRMDRLKATAQRRMGRAKVQGMYDRAVSVNRATQAFPDTGMATQGFASIYTDIACVIQMKRPRGDGLKTDDSPLVFWEATLDPEFTGTIMQDDQLTDDMGRAFRVEAAYPTPFGWQLLCKDWSVESK